MPRKPTGRMGPVSFGPEGIKRHFIELPEAKDEIELLIAKAFCEPKNVGMKPQIDRYECFHDLEQQSENDLDFKVETARGAKWLELTEFAPLKHFGGKYENAPSSWDAATAKQFAIDLIHQKAGKGYGEGVILLIYKTDSKFLLPPSILRSMQLDLAQEKLPFEAIYYVSMMDQESAMAWEILPGDPNLRADDPFVQDSGTYHLMMPGLDVDGTSS